MAVAQDAEIRDIFRHPAHDVIRAALHEFDLDAGVRRLERREEMRQQHARDTREAGNRQPPRVDAADFRDLLCEQLFFGKQVAHVRQDHLPRRRELDAVLLTHEEREAELLFEQTQRPAHGRLRVAHAVCRFREISRLCCIGKDFVFCQFHITTPLHKHTKKTKDCPAHLRGSLR